MLIRALAFEILRVSCYLCNDAVIRVIFGRHIPGTARQSKEALRLRRYSHSSYSLIAFYPRQWANTITRP